MPVTTRQTRDIERMLRDQAYRIANPAASLAVEAARLKAIVDAAYSAGRSPAGRAWPRLASGSRDARTGRGAARYDAGGTPGVRTGALRGGISVSSGRSGIAAEDAVPYAAYRQWGTRKNGRRMMPARAFLPVTGAGRPVRTGPAGDWYRALHDRLARYVVTGRE